MIGQLIKAPAKAHLNSASISVERFELNSLDRRLVLVKMGEGILGSVVGCIVVRVNCLSFKTSDGIKFFYGGSAQPGESSEHSTLDFSHLRILNCVNKSVLSLRGMVLELLGSVLFAKWGYLVEVHFKIMGHFLCKLILWCSLRSNLQEGALGSLALRRRGAVRGCSFRMGTL